jgi:flagellar hook assembly protein FlgD
LHIVKPAEEFSLLNCRPNPMIIGENSALTIDYQLDKTREIVVTVVDITGKRIKLLSEREALPGYLSISWDGKNQDGEVVSEGVYYIILKDKDNTFKKKIYIIK